MALKQAEAAHAMLGAQVRHVVLDLESQAQWQRERVLAQGAGLSTAEAIGFAAQCVAEFGTLEDALRLARWAKGRAMQAWPNVTVAEAIPEYMSGQQVQGLAEATKKNKRDIFGRLMRVAFEWCSNTYLHAITADSVARLLESLNLTAPAYNSLAMELRALLTWAQGRNYIDPDKHPLTRLKKRPVKENEILCLQPSQMRALLRAACATNRPGIGLFVALGAFAGIRPNECRRVKWQDVSLEEGVISVRHTASKTGGTRHVTLRPVLTAWLAYFAPPDSRDPHALLCAEASPLALNRLHRAAGFTSWQADCLRHSFASYSLKAGTPLHQVQQDMGHVGLDLLRTRYLNMVGLTSAGAREWWSLTPGEVLET